MKFLKASAAMLMVFCIVFTFIYGKDKINNPAPLAETVGYKGIITMWHVDSFEGGTGSRRQFLMEVARSFEKDNEGVLIMVINHTPEGVKENMDNGIYPDLISFGAGTEVKNMSELRLSRTTSGCLVGDKIYATAWCRGGYVLIANPALATEFGERLNEVVVSQSDYTEPLLALYLEGYAADTIKVMSPMDAYVKFVEGKTPYFLGTQRDINRLERRGMEVVTRPLSAYNDLYQYVAVTSPNELKRYYALSFAEYLCTDSVQSKLNKIGMLSPYNPTVYENRTLSDMQGVKFRHTLSAFSSPELLKELQELSMSALSGKLSDETKIKNVLI